MPRKLNIHIGHAVFIALTLAAFQLLVASGSVSVLILSPPSAVFWRLVQDFGDKELWTSILTTVREVLAALTISIVLGMLLGYVLYRFSIFRRATEPWLVAFYSAPAMLTYPIIMSLLGQSSATVITMAVILGTIPIAINVSVGFRSLEPIWLKVARSMNATRLQIVRKVLLPASVPIVATGLRLGMTFALIGVISIEFLTYSGGLGRLISWRYFTFDTDGVYAAVVIVALIAMLINAALNHGQQRMVARWAGN